MKKFAFLPYLVLSLLLTLAVGCSKDSDEPEIPEKPVEPEKPTEEWVDVVANSDAWDSQKRADIAYQLLIYSFADGDGDKYGDIQGIISKLDYINSLGVNAIWLSPIHPSPSYHGYDVEDYTKINPKFGTDADFDRLVSEAHSRGIKIYLDFVLNHTSVNHPWFQAAKASADNEYRNRYIFSQDPASDIKAGKIDMIASEGENGYAENEWFTLDTGEEVSACYKFTLDWSNSSKPTVTITAGNEADVKKNTAPAADDDKFIWFGDEQCEKFFSLGNGKYELTINFVSSWGFLIRTSNTTWDNGTKYGSASSTDKISLNTAFELDNKTAANIVLSGMNLWKYHSGFWTGSFADLNYGKVGEWDNSAAYQAITSAAKGWIARGVDGFRLDAVKHIYHNASGNENPDFLHKFYTDMNAAYKAAGHTDDIYIVGEVLSEAGEVAPYYQGLPALFEFSFWYRLEWAINNGTGCYFAKDIFSYQQQYAGYRPNYIEATKLSNHDEDRAGYKLGKSLDKEKLAAAVLLTSAGEPYLYYGEELGFYNSKSSGDQHVREPMQWGEGTDTDFGEEVSKSSVKSVKEQQADENSLLNVYKKFTTLRNTYPALAQGRMEKHDTYNENNADNAKQIAAWYMKTDNQAMLVVHNFGSTAIDITLTDKFDKAVGVNGTVKSQSVAEATQVRMGAYSTVVYLLK